MPKSILSKVERARIACRKYYWSHLENSRKRAIDFYHNNIDKLRHQARKNYANNKEILRERAKRWRRAHPDYKKNYMKTEAGKAITKRANQRSYERIRDFNLRKKYGIGIDDYNRMFESQNGVCAICKRPERFCNKWGTINKHLRIDHCHKTGVVRGLLCAKCNIALGYFEDNPSFLFQAGQYLSHSSGSPPLSSSG